MEINGGEDENLFEVGDSLANFLGEPVSIQRPLSDDAYDSVAASSVCVPVEPKPETNANFDHVGAQRAFSRSLTTAAPSFIWESNGFLVAVFGKKDITEELFRSPALKRPALWLPPDCVPVDDKMETPLAKAFRAGTPRPLYMQALTRSSLENEGARRQTLLSSRTSLVMLDVNAFTAFDDMPVDATVDVQRDFVPSIVSECLACKATSTVAKRLGSMVRFVEFCKTEELIPVPLLEHNLHAYMVHLVSNEQSSAKSGRSFIEAARFSGAMSGLTGNRAMIVSQRVSGLAKSVVLRAPPILQAAPLTVEQITRLEKLCCSAESLQDRVLLGGILIMVYGCARASDVARTTAITLDCAPSDSVRVEGHSDDPSGYIELSVLGHKGARSDVHKRTILPVVAPMVSVSGAKWFDAWG